MTMRVACAICGRRLEWAQIVKRWRCPVCPDGFTPEELARMQRDTKKMLANHKTFSDPAVTEALRRACEDFEE